MAVIKDNVVGEVKGGELGQQEQREQIEEDGAEENENERAAQEGE